ncbi:MAG: HD domain-containing protein [Humidesulfovibrio sp.]|jgi:predicted hydrolase (HD superfamily)|uniref:HD domain-containing protein n=1 Tax=Humidesulfovibrio sp. TaxID=2910988 RepID=UPI002732E4C1|nr:HD domain-containing protein [Humidesulfovibrio sp.]MDP2848637.1 HD domain-containing protein [Humidesulfovibrio sp.]
MIDRNEAYALMTAHVAEPALQAHCLESEAVLRALAARLGQDQNLWGITGLLHDLDYATTKDNPARHGLDSAEFLDGKLPVQALDAIRAHNFEHTGFAPSTPLDFALRCGETVTGLIHTNALVRPARMDGMDAKSLKKKMKDKAFAASVNRETIGECQKLGLEPSEFFTIAIAAVAGIAPQVGLA